MNRDTELKKGTTTVGIVCKGGVVVGTEHRATMGTLIAHKKTQKLFMIDEHMGLTVAGLVGDAQVLARWLMAHVELYKLRQGKDISIQAAATYMANVLNNNKFYPFWVQLVIAGIDESGPSVFSLDAAGGSIPDDYVTTGSGSPYVYGVLEDHYKSNISTTQGLELAVRGLNAAIKRDSASGNGMEIAIITNKGFRIVPDEDVQSILQKYGLT